MTISDQLGLVIAMLLEHLHESGQHEELLALAQPLVPTDPATVADDDLMVIAVIASYAAGAANESGQLELMRSYADTQVALGSRLPAPSLILARGYAWRALGYETAGRFLDAVADYEAGLAVVGELRDHPGVADVEAMLRMNYSDLLVTRGDTRPALLDGLPPTETGDLSLSGRNLRATRLIAEGDLSSGLELLTKIQADAMAQGKPRMAGVVASNIGTALLDAGDPNAAIPHLDTARDLLSVPGSGEQLGVACAALGRAHNALGQRDLAVAALKQAWDAFRRDAPRSVKALYVLRDLGMMRIAQRDFRRARAVLTRGLELYESSRAEIGRLEVEHEATMRAYRAIIEMHLYLSMEEGWIDEAHTLIERGKARFWAESLLMLDTEQSRAEEPTGDHPTRYRFTDAAIDRLVLNYFVGPNATFVVIWNGPQPSVRRINAGEDEIRELVEEVTFDLLASSSRSADTTGGAAAELAALLLRDVDVRPARSVVILPDGPLWGLPFDPVLAAAEGAPTELPPLSLAPAMHIVRLIERRPRTPASRGVWRMLAAGSPAAGAGFSPIPGTRAQLDWIKETFPATEVLVANFATRDEVCERIDDATHVHIAAHAFASPDDDRPYIVLSNGNDGPDRWHAADIAQLSLQAELIFLSACSTSVGRLSTGEGVASLGRAFLHAGADCVVSTLWPVVDAESVRLVRLFYTFLADGNSVAVSARRAQEALRRSGASPRMWSALQVIGDGHAGEDQRATLLERMK